MQSKIFLLIWMYSLVHIIMELYNVLAQGLLATSITKLAICYNKPGIRFASRVAKQLTSSNLSKWGNIRKISNLVGDSQMPSLPSEN